MENYIWVVTKHENIIEGHVSSISYYYRAESKDKAMRKYEQLCKHYENVGYTCDHDDRFGTIEDVAGMELRSSFRDYVKDKRIKRRAEVEIAPERIK